MNRFRLSQRQVEAVLEIRLRQLARLEEIRIREEQFSLRKERDELDATINSDSRLKLLVIQEIEAAADKYGDERRSPLREKEAARAFTSEELNPSEPITVVLSKSGWIRSAKGHEIDADQLNYREGDEFLASTTGKSNESLICMDSTGRMYTLQVHKLPSARSYGEPLTKMLNPTADARFTGLLLGSENIHCLLASSEGNGFVCKLSNAVSKNRSGKAILTIKDGYEPLPIERIDDFSQYVAVITNVARILIYPIKDLPVQMKGGGVRMISIPKPAKLNGESISFVKVFSANQDLIIHSGRQHLRLKRIERERFLGERTLRGTYLPKGYRNVHKVEVES